MAVFYDEGQAEGAECPECGSTETYNDATFGFWKCEACSLVWGGLDGELDEQGNLNLEEAVEPLLLNAEVQREDKGLSDHR